MYDFVIIGGGIVGISTAYHLVSSAPGAKVLVLEKEPSLGLHQTGRNSGVIHSGIYYRPGSLKARFAVEGSRAMYAFCRRHDIPHERCGKVIVAVREEERPQLEALYRRGIQNGLRLKKLTPEELREKEPHVRGLEALYVPDTGIVDFRRVLRVLAAMAEEKGVEIRTSAGVEEIEEHREWTEVHTSGETVRTRFLINCAGLFSDRIARRARVSLDLKIVPFRGEYYELRPEKRHLVKNLIYPVPNPSFPFLGVHFTRMIDGTVHVGPNAVLALKREGYRKRDICLRDALEVFAYPAFWKIAFRHMPEGIGELVRSFSKGAMVRLVRRYLPEINGGDLIPAPAGVRAQALSRDGRLLDDFVILRSKRGVHVCNAPSPAATASLRIGSYIAERVLEGPFEKSTG
ncbi:L-2-hydroxyglutarate oxidase [Planifilum fulgidum]|jgi:L-2-hydroxyglutarate oxidase|uniref:L-2-hydroxyglutarate oxidase n=1 Tax=Planifilum fulgidum TaxID=201973 RepID=A0A1I2PLK1_9BACL|nr:L-2-hydroxyglutarate oxidase [Planifilum fulgidum]SFG17032.1 L-2-hydroxyglutarate oxidase [Planifilum fulgidum]